MNTIFYGSSGRVGGLINLSNLDGKIFYAKRDGQFQINNLFIDKDSLIRELTGQRIKFIDLSIDYSGLENMVEHENQKKILFEELLNVSLFDSYIGMSSGAAQFLPSIIEGEFFKKYSILKKSQECFLNSLDIPVFFPQLFTLIGKRSFEFKTTGWVNIVEQAKVSRTIEISDPYELRSWVSEATLTGYLDKFLKSPGGKLMGAVVDGNFCLAQLVDIVDSFYFHQSKIVIKKGLKKWLPVAYINQFSGAHYGSNSLENVLSEIL
jgi:hypothetical protein